MPYVSCYSLLLFSYSFHVPCIILSNVYFYVTLIDHNQKQVLLSKESSFFRSSKIFFYSFQLFENAHIHNVVLTLINVMKLDVKNNSIVSVLSNFVNINFEIDNVDMTLLNIVNFNFDIQNVVSTLILHWPMSRRHITLTTTSRPR